MHARTPGEESMGRRWHAGHHHALEAKGAPGGLIPFADEDHGTVTRSNQVLAIGHTLAFLDRYLKQRGVGDHVCCP